MKIRNKLISKILSISISCAVLLNSMPLTSCAEEIKNSVSSVSTLINNIDFHTAGSEPESYFDFTSDTINITAPDMFALLSQCNAELYQEKTIQITYTGSDKIWKFNEDSGFMGLGSNSFPFAGRLLYSNQTSVSFCMDRALFNAIDDSVEFLSVIGEDATGQPTTALASLTLIRNNKEYKAPLLAEKVFSSDSSHEKRTWNIKIDDNSGYIKDDDPHASDNAMFLFGGVIGEISDYCALYLKIDNSNENLEAHISAEAHVNGGADDPIPSKSGSAGMICGQLGKNSDLTVTYIGHSAYNVTAENGNAGALVGSVLSGAKLNITFTDTEKNSVPFEYAGTVTASGNDAEVLGTDVPTGCAGGFVGYMHKSDDSEFTLNAQNTKITASVRGEQVSGGYIGYLSTENGFNLNTQFNNINNVTISAEISTGGLFGVLNNLGEEKSVDIAGGTVYSVLEYAAYQHGGLVGRYYADNLSSSLNIGSHASGNIAETTENVDSDINSFGGLIGSIESADGAYVKIYGENEAGIKTTVTNSKIVNYGGIVAKSSDNGNFVNIDTGLKLTATGGFNGSESSGGIAGDFASGVLRLNGAVDMSGAEAKGKGTTHGWIIGSRNDTLIYQTDAYTLSRFSNTSIVNDIGNWGKVVNLKDDSADETENKYDCYFNYDNVAHTVTIPSATTEISTNDELYKLALNLQLNSGENKGALIVKEISPHCSSNSFNKKITIKSDAVSPLTFVGTGITGLFKDDGSQKFSGELDGGGKTIVLDINDGTYESDKKRYICTHTHSGLIAKTAGGLKIHDLTISGSINAAGDFQADSKDVPIYVGGLIGEHSSGSAEISNVTVEHSCTFKGKNPRVAGFIGKVSGGTLTFKNECKLSGSISNETEVADVYCGGLIAEAASASININKIEDKYGIIIDGLNMTLKSSSTAGGFLGYSWENTNVNLDGLKITETDSDKHTQLKVNESKSVKLGGLVNKASGYWKITNLEFDKAEISSKASEFGLLIHSGLESKLYVELVTADDEDNKWNNYRINNATNGLILNLTGNPVFDEFLCEGSGDVVSIPTKDGNGITNEASVTEGKNSNIYYNRTSFGNGKDNKNTRYYYNLDKIRKKATDNTTYNGEELLLWSIRQYTSADYFKGRTTDPFNFSGECDLRGLSYYPVDLKDNQTFNTMTVIFDNKLLDSNNSHDATAAECQHQYMQTGIINNIHTDGLDKSLNITGTLTLKGTVGKHGDGSGALVCGSVKGVSNGSSINSGIVQCNSDAGIILDGVYIRDVSSSNPDEYAPLLINKLEEYSNCTMIGVKTKGVKTNDVWSYSMDNQDYAATSLIGYAGSDTAKGVNINFEKITLNSRKTEDAINDALNDAYQTRKSIFKNATLLETFQYAEGDGSSSGAYNFAFTEDWTRTENNGSYTYTGKHNVTYGYEITYSVDNANEQKHYLTYDEDTDPYYSTPISSNLPTVTNGKSKEYRFSDDDFLHYVAHSHASDKPKEDNNNKIIEENKTYHELDVNIFRSLPSSGCGTYGDPYVISDGSQLEYIAKLINGQSFAGKVKICFPASSNDTNFKKFVVQNTSDCNGNNNIKHHEYTLNGDYFEYNTEKINKINAQIYLRNAYYIIRPDVEDDEAWEITLSSEFSGLGNEDNSQQIFKGVIVGDERNGEYPTVNIEGENACFIKVSGGSVVKNLNINYNNDNNAISLTQDISENVSKERFKPYYGLSTNVTGCNYWGGVIGQVFAGDNIIDNVEVSFSQGTTIEVRGKHDYLIPVGAYVGINRNGGLILRHMSEKRGIPEAVNSKVADSKTDYLYFNSFVGRVLDGWVACDDNTLDAGNINGTKNYTIAKLVKPTSSNNYGKISITNPNDSNNTNNYTFYKTSGEKAFGLINLPDSQSIFVLSCMVATGACAYEFYTHSSQPTGYSDNGYFYDNIKNNTRSEINTGHFPKLSSYDIGRTHLGNYDNVGHLGSDKTDFNESIKGRSHFAESDNSGDNDTVPYLIYYYTENQPMNKKDDNNTKMADWASRAIAAPNTRFSMKLSAPQGTVYDMAQYGSAFHGINSMFNQSTYTFNLDRQVINMFGFDGNDCTVNLAMNVKTYGSSDPYNPYGVGLFTRFQQNASGDLPKDIIHNGKTLNYNDAADWSKMDLTALDSFYVVKDLTLTGSVQYENIRGTNTFTYTLETNKDYDTVTGTSNKRTNVHVNTGAFAGRTYEGRIKYISPYFKNITLGTEENAMTVSGGYYSGGLIGGSFTIDGSGYYNLIAENIKANDLTVDGQMHAGGMAGYLKNYSKSIVIDGSHVEKVTENGEEVEKVITDNVFKLTHIRASDANNICGGIIGSLNSKASVKNMNVQKKGTSNADIGQISDNTNKILYSGGIVGYSASALTMENCSVDKCNINSKQYSGGIIGRAENTVNADGCYVSDCSIKANNNNALYVGGIAGGISKDTIITNSSVIDCTLNCDVSNSDNTIYCGGLIGLINGGYNSNSVAIQNTLFGYNLYVENNNMIIANNTNNDGKHKIYIGNWIGYTYNITTIKINDVTKKYPNTALVQLIAVSKNGGSAGLQEKDIGYQDQVKVNNIWEDIQEEDISKYINSDNYFIYADYNNLAAPLCTTTTTTTGAETTTTTTSTYGESNPNGIKPYVNVNPYTIDESLNAVGLYGDAFITANIINGSKNDVGGYTSGKLLSESIARSPNKKAYTNVSELANKFVGTKEITEGGETKIVRQDYADNIFRYSELSDNEISDRTFPSIDIPVLLVDGQDSNEITAMVNSYISVLTNCNQTAEKKYKTIVPMSFTWRQNSDNTRTFVKSSGKSASLTYKDDVLSITPGQYDNQLGRFTVLDVQYTDPSFVAPADEPDKEPPVVYHLYIPIFVKKLLEFSYIASCLPGTEFLASNYTAVPYSDRKVTCSAHGIPITSLITFTYHRTALEWENAINGGENELFAFDKYVWLDHDEGDNINALPEGTMLTLVDRNDPTKVYQAVLSREKYNDFIKRNKTETSTEMYGFLRFSDYFTNCLDGTPFNTKNVLLCDLVCQSTNVTVNENNNTGTLIIDDDEDENHPRSTFRIKNNNSVSYYRLYDESEFYDSEGNLKEGMTAPIRYTVSVEDVIVFLFINRMIFTQKSKMNSII